MQMLLNPDNSCFHNEYFSCHFTVADSSLSLFPCPQKTETRLRQEKLNRQQLEGELSEHRALIDALTAEVLLAREENIAMQVLPRIYVT